ncbi:MAG: hypothetical protein UX23_C0008G0020 [Parcubacteria group bacterium GW2011_GWB1_45_9]|nr:MAG: hypothetical protein UX23_C0008G0020 [Parcubacteria group bacterium GW2011_GWB1_45_9]
MKKSLWGLLFSIFTLYGCSTVSIMPSDTNTTIGGLGLINVTKIYNAIEPYHTTLADLKQSGFDPNETKNILRLGPEILRTDIFMKNSSVKMEELPQGIQDCFKKSEECLGYQISEIEQERQGQGSFLMRWLNFKREDLVSERKAEILFLVKNGLVIYKTWLQGTGPAGTSRLEIKKNPLGPLQEIFFPGKKLLP